MSQDSVISAQSLQYLIVPVEGRDDNGVLDPTSLPVEFAFLPQDDVPEVATVWHLGAWFTVEQTNLDDIYKARVRIGPGGGAVILTTGSWDIWIRVTHVTETPVVKAGTILIV